MLKRFTPRTILLMLVAFSVTLLLPKMGVPQDMVSNIILPITGITLLIALIVAKALASKQAESQ